jgi:hypothetical protein
MPLVAGTQKRGAFSPENQDDIIYLMLAWQVVQTLRNAAIPAAGFLDSIAGLGRISASAANTAIVGLLELSPYPIPSWLTGFVLSLTANSKFYDVLDEVLTFGLSPDDYYVWGDSERNLPSGEFTAGAIFRANNRNYTIKPIDPSASLLQQFGADAGSVSGLLGGIWRDMGWLAFWDNPVEFAIPEVPQRLQSIFVEQGAAMATGGGILADSVIRTGELTAPGVVPQRESETDTEIEITTGVKVNTTLLILAGALALTPAKLVSIPIALAAFRGK